MYGPVLLVDVGCDVDDRRPLRVRSLRYTRRGERAEQCCRQDDDTQTLYQDLSLRESVDEYYSTGWVVVCQL